MIGREMITAKTASKLAKVCGLFGSDQVGERAAAAWRADQIVRAAGITWDALLADIGRAKSETEQHRQHLGPRDLLTRFPSLLTRWEMDFLESLANRPRSLTAKQQKIYAEIHRRVTGGAE